MDVRPISRLTHALVLLTAMISGCGGVGFQVGDDDREEKIAAMRNIVTQPTEPLQVATVPAPPPTNGIGARDAAGVIGTFSYDADLDHLIVITIVNTVARDCPDEAATEPKLLWRELDAAAATVAETEVEPTDKFAAKAGTRYDLIVDLTTPRGRCREMGLKFRALRY